MTEDPGRLARAGVPDHVEFATKPELAQRMLTDALEAGVLASWVAGDEVYGAATALRTSCREHGVGYVLNVACNHHLVTAQCRVDAVVAQMPTFAWQRLSAGAGSKGPRMYSWLLIDVASTLPGHEWIMVRRNDSTGELAYYRCWSPHLVPLRLWSVSPVGDGPSRNPSRLPKAKRDLMNTKSAPGPPGGAG